MLVRDPARLRASMAASKISFSGLAEAAGVSAGFISHLIPSSLPAPRPGEARCPITWPGGARCVGMLGHDGKHAKSEAPRRRSCTPAVAARIASALDAPIDYLFELRSSDEPTTGPLQTMGAARQTWENVL